MHTFIYIYIYIYIHLFIYIYIYMIIIKINNSIEPIRRGSEQKKKKAEGG